MIKCPWCGSMKVSVIDSKPNTAETEIRRRRKCDDCDGRWTTHERYIDDWKEDVLDIEEKEFNIEKLKYEQAYDKKYGDGTISKKIQRKLNEKGYKKTYSHAYYPNKTKPKRQGRK